MTVVFNTRVISYRHEMTRTGKKGPRLDASSEKEIKAEQLTLCLFYSGHQFTVHLTMDESDTNSSDLDELSYWQREPKSLLLSEPSDEDEDVECVTSMEQMVGQQFSSDLITLVH